MKQGLAAILTLMALSGFASIPDWDRVDAGKAIAALRAGCAQETQRAQMSDLCREVQSRADRSPAQQRALFDQYFTPQKLTEDGLLTGYYLPLLQGSLTPSPDYPYPVWGVPKDFRTPYLTREEIDRHGLEGKAEVLLWVKDKVDLFFLHVQGSGQVELPDGTHIGLGFAAKNGQPYQSIGRVLVERGDLPKDDVTLHSIKEWLRVHTSLVDELLWQNPSYIFFRKQKPKEAIGGQGVPLTPEASLAVDPAVIPYGTPVLIRTTLPEEQFPRWILGVAQDTGSAITGRNRIDWFLGEGKIAEDLAGKMKQPAEFILLRPKGFADE